MGRPSQKWRVFLTNCRGGKALLRSWISPLWSLSSLVTRRCIGLRPTRVYAVKRRSGNGFGSGLRLSNGSEWAIEIRKKSHNRLAKRKKVPHGMARPKKNPIMAAIMRHSVLANEPLPVNSCDAAPKRARRLFLLGFRVGVLRSRIPHHCLRKRTHRKFWYIEGHHVFPYVMRAGRTVRVIRA